MPIFNRASVVEVAWVTDSNGKILLTFDHQWRAYSLPMRRARRSDLKLYDGFGAVQAVREAFVQGLPHASARHIAFLSTSEYSWRTKQKTAYNYDVYTVNPGEPIDEGGFGMSFGFVSDQEILLGKFDLISPTAEEIVQKLIAGREVSVAVVQRDGGTSRELLLVYNANYGAYFFPASTWKRKDAAAKSAASDALSQDLGLNRRQINISKTKKVPATQFSATMNRRCKFDFHVCRAEVKPELVDEALQKTDLDSRWFTASEIDDAVRQNRLLKNGMSPTLGHVWDAVLEIL